jgi:D-aminoacyl-tRNA deacylase
MVSIIYNDIDTVSRNAYNYIISASVTNQNALNLVKVGKELINSELPANLIEPAIFMSKHVSSKNVASFTVHAEGNWSSKAELGGKPYTLSMSSPIEMLNVLIQMSKLAAPSMEVTFEATHHGPYTTKRSFFAEVGGNDDVIKNPKMAEILAKSIISSLDMGNNSKKIAVGIGGNHYSSRFTKMALNDGYAFSHIMSRYYITETDMLDQAFQMSYPKPEIAVIEWKSISSSERLPIINKLESMGIEYERV